MMTTMSSGATVTPVAPTAAERKAWLIFYTYDVADEPSHVGCTPRLLEAAVSEAVASGCAVLTIRNALGAVVFVRPHREESAGPGAETPP